MRWLGLDWDEGPEVGGPLRPLPAVASARTSTPTSPRGCATAGYTYDCYCTTEELDARREGRAAEGCTPATTATAASSPTSRSPRYEAEGRKPVVRFRMPDERDHLRRPGPRRASPSSPRTSPTSRSSAPTAHPLYTLVNPVDDALMEITHVLRGEDLLSSHPAPDRALRRRSIELGVANGHAARSATCPTSWARATRSCPSATRGQPARLPRARLPARGPAQLPGPARLGDRRRPRHLLASRRWSRPSTSTDVNPNPARFDLKKAEAINAAHMRLLSVEEIDRSGCCRSSQAAGVRRRPGHDAEQRQLLDAGHAAGRTSGSTSSPRPSTCWASSSSTRRPSSATRPTSPSCSTRPGRGVVQGGARRARGAADLDDRRASTRRSREALVEELGLKPRNAFGPVRVAVTGRRVSPPLFESLELLGRERAPRAACSSALA